MLYISYCSFNALPPLIVMHTNKLHWKWAVFLIYDILALQSVDIALLNNTLFKMRNDNCNHLVTTRVTNIFDISNLSRYCHDIFFKMFYVHIIKIKPIFMARTEFIPILSWESLDNNTLKAQDDVFLDSRAQTLPLSHSHIIEDPTS